MEGDKNNARRVAELFLGSAVGGATAAGTYKLLSKNEKVGAETLNPEDLTVLQQIAVSLQDAVDKIDTLASAVQSLVSSQGILPVSSYPVSPYDFPNATNWKIDVTDIDNMTLEPGKDYTLYSSKFVKGWLQRWSLMGSSKLLTFTLTIASKNWTHTNVASINDVYMSGYTRPTGTLIPYVALFDEAANLYNIASDIVFPGFPFNQEIHLKITNADSVPALIQSADLTIIELTD